MTDRDAVPTTEGADPDFEALWAAFWEVWHSDESSVRTHPATKEAARYWWDSGLANVARPAPADAPREGGEMLARIVRESRRDGMLFQGRHVVPARMEWETLSDQDREPDAYIASRVAAAAREGDEELARAIEMVDRWYRGQRAELLLDAKQREQFAPFMAALQRVLDAAREAARGEG